MKAIIIPHRPCAPEDLVIKDVPDPTPIAGMTTIAVRAFGINHAELHMRRGEWAESTDISGIECVGTVHACPDGSFAVGATVAALMGGLGRTINGSYAEYTNVPSTNVVLIAGPGEEVGMPWEELAALPESYATAWTVLMRNLEIKEGEKVLIRGATSALGTAALQLAVNQVGAKVWATTRQQGRVEELMALGVDGVELEHGNLSEKLRSKGLVFDKVLNLVGNTVLLDSLKIPRRGGRVCLAGFLGGLDPIEFNPLAQMASGVHLSFFGSFVFGTDEFPLGDVPLHLVVKDVANGEWDAKPSKVFPFEKIGEAHRHMEQGTAGGKMVVLGL